MLIQQICPACIVLVCWLLSARGHHMDFVKDDEEATNRTKEWTAKENKRIAKPHLDLYVQDDGILLMTEVYQIPLHVEINILMNNVTIDVTRYENYTCYNIHGKCSSTICSCIVENNIFTSTYHLTFRKKYMTLGLEYRFIREIDGAIVKVCLFKTFDGANFSRQYTNFVTLHTFAADRNDLNIPKRIAKPHLDLYVQDDGILLMTEVYQTPLHVEINILMNNVTIDVTRYENNTCYNIHGKCSSTICSCIVENNIFTSTYHLTFRKKYMTLGLEYRFIREIDGAIVKVCLFKTFDGANFSRLYTNFVTLHTFAADRNDLNIPSTNIKYNKKKLGKPRYIWVFIILVICVTIYIIYHVYRSEPTCKTGGRHEEQIKNKDPPNCSTNWHRRSERTNVLDRSPSEQLMLPEKDSSSEDDARDIESVHSKKLSNLNKHTTTVPDISINTNIDFESCRANELDRAHSEQLMLPENDSSPEGDARNIRANELDRAHSEQLMSPEKDSSPEDDARNIVSLNSDKLSSFEKDTTTSPDISINTNLEYESCEKGTNVPDRSPSKQLMLPEKDSSSEDDARDIESVKQMDQSFTAQKALLRFECICTLCFRNGTNVPDRSPSKQLMLPEKDSSSEDDAREIESVHSDKLSNLNKHTTTVPNISINTNIESCERENPPKTQKVDNDKEVKKKLKTGSSALSLLNIDDKSITGSDMTDLYVPYYMDSALSAKTSIIRNTESENIDEFGEITIPAENTIFGIDLYKIGQILSRFPVIGVVISGAVGGMIDTFSRRTPD